MANKQSESSSSSSSCTMAPGGGGRSIGRPSRTRRRCPSREMCEVDRAQRLGHLKRRANRVHFIPRRVGLDQ